MAKASADIRSLARSHTARAIRVLAGLMDQPKTPAAARVAAASVLLDRGWGKPKQEIESTIRRITAQQLADDILADIAVGGGNGTAEPPIDPTTLN